MRINLQQSRRRLSGLTLAEVMIATGLGSLVLACVASLSVYGTRSSVALLNYTDLDSKSRYASDLISSEMREATEVVRFRTAASDRMITLKNSTNGTEMTLSWDPTSRKLVLERTGQDPLTVLTECDRWNFGLYQRTPIVTGTNLVFLPATNAAGDVDLNLCKLINMSWKCSRTILAQKVNTESVQAAQIVLRNKH